MWLTFGKWLLRQVVAELVEELVEKAKKAK